MIGRWSRVLVESEGNGDSDAQDTGNKPPDRGWSSVCRYFLDVQQSLEFSFQTLGSCYLSRPGWKSRSSSARMMGVPSSQDGGGPERQGRGSGAGSSERWCRILVFVNVQCRRRMGTTGRPVWARRPWPKGSAQFLTTPICGNVLETPVVRAWRIPLLYLR